MRNWLEIGKTAIFKDSLKGGLLSNFLREYKEEFGGTVNPSCQKCLNSYWENYKKSLNMSDSIKCDYELLKKYSGLQFPFGSKPIRNATLTNEQALFLLKNHPRGEKLFSKLPEIKEIEVKEEEVIEGEKEVKKPTAKKKRTRKTTK